MRVGIVGAGATGLTAAYDAVKAGHDVTVLEASAELGGLAASIEVGGTPLERFYHHSFRTDRAMIGLVEELGLGHLLWFHRPTTGVYVDGQLHDFGTPQEMLRFPGFSLLDKFRFGATAAVLKAVRGGQRFNSVRALEWMRRWAGRRVTANIWEPLLEGKFGIHAEQISMAWLWARIHYRTFELGYVHGGFEQVYRALLDAVTERGGKVEFGKPVATIRQPGATVLVGAGDGSSYEFDRVIVTVPQPVFAQAAGIETDDVLWRNQYLGATCFILECDRSVIPHYWLNINDTAFPFLAVVEHTNMVDPAEYGGRHIVYVGNYVPRNDWRFNTDPAELLERYVPWLRKLNPEFDRSWIRNWHFSKAPFAQPIVTPEYRSLIPGHRTKMPGVTLATMSQIYPQDRGQSYAIAMAHEVTDRLGLSNRRP
ncbi:Protoporphyrinogen oxidase [Saccharopolyspora antimicrobica]|uniref:Protoporphyrinogen oxidase n=1 Tax=Saccharopolyspora antimicrobica TaxID=455193 RepID=A0A1I4WZV6_9PSEU|nr:NAD(P)/FAD-dependent oxidoreductase [Saccharopolyspora antimicrobica]RKT84242.1 UDP-galactopyranose mutase [Saccharopolyspora antimicrobica]SFN19261.1 Protoporphyrinogen oxidase [Saccharopolyspora antimicrobica]